MKDKENEQEQNGQQDKQIDINNNEEINKIDKIDNIDNIDKANKRLIKDFIIEKSNNENFFFTFKYGGKKLTGVKNK